MCKLKVRSSQFKRRAEEAHMLKSGLSWLIGIPIPIIIVLMLFMHH